MIVVRLSGRLGNQLFQYAAGRALALRHGVDIGFDARGYVGKRRDHYALDAFAIKAAPIDDISLPGPDRRLLSRLFARSRKTPFSIFQERRFTFDPTVLTLPDWSYLEGYFQSELYFAEAAGMLRHELAIVPPPDEANRALASEIMATANAVSLHVRRGDYVTNPKIGRVFCSLNLDYYRRAAGCIAAQSGADPAFFVFSDDTDWAAANLQLPFPTRIVRQQGPAYEDLRLMSACRHHIIANSSFSWWGAWLNPTPDKIVVAPRNWFTDIEVDAATLIPDRWITL